MDGRIKSIEEIAREKDEWRRKQAALPWPEKIRIMIELQKRSAPLKRMRGLTPRIWELEDEPSSETESNPPQDNKT